MYPNDSSSLSLAAKKLDPSSYGEALLSFPLGNAPWPPFLQVRHHSLLPPERARSRLPLLLQPPVHKKVPRKKCFPNLHATSNLPRVFSPGRRGLGEAAGRARAARRADDDCDSSDGGEATKEVPRPASATCERGPTFASLADERAADDLGVLLIGGGVSRVNSPSNAERRSLSLRRSSRASSADSRSRKSAAVHPVTLKMLSRAFEVDIKLEKPSKDAAAGSPNQLADRPYMFDGTGEKENLIRYYKHTISSLISSRIGDMNRESRMLQESECKRKGAHRPRRAPPAAGKTTAPSGSTRCMYDSIGKQMMRKPRQFSFH